jgi:hypothetical protein
VAIHDRSTIPFGFVGTEFFGKHCGSCEPASLGPDLTDRDFSRCVGDGTLLHRIKANPGIAGNASRTGFSSNRSNCFIE